MQIFIILICNGITEFYKIKVNVRLNVIISPRGLAHLGAWQLPIFLDIHQRQAADSAIFSCLILFNLAINRKGTRKTGSTKINQATLHFWDMPGTSEAAKYWVWHWSIQLRIPDSDCQGSPRCQTRISLCLNWRYCQGFNWDLLQTKKLQPPISSLPECKPIMTFQCIFQIIPKGRLLYNTSVPLYLCGINSRPRWGHWNCG